MLCFISLRRYTARRKLRWVQINTKIFYKSYSKIIHDEIFMKKIICPLLVYYIFYFFLLSLVVNIVGQTVFKNYYIISTRYKFMACILSPVRLHPLSDSQTSGGHFQVLVTRTSNSLSVSEAISVTNYLL